ncbi:MAG: zinc finger domain-containing protein [Candidatus Acidiferrales bacterium]
MLFPVAKLKLSIPEVLPSSPVSLACPFCKAKPGRDCATTSGTFSAIHIQRIKAAASLDKATTRKEDQRRGRK